MSLNEFLELNKDMLKQYKETADDQYWHGARGFGRHTLHELFRLVIEDGELFYLPFLLLTIYFGDGVERNEEFAFSSLHSIANSNALAAYYYAYCLHVRGSNEEAFKILEGLARHKFSPAVLSLGDWNLKYGTVQEALNCYQHAHELGQINALSVYHWVRVRNSNFIIKSLYAIKEIIGRFRVLRQFYKDRMVGIKWVSLDFYNRIDI